MQESLWGLSMGTFWKVLFIPCSRLRVFLEAVFCFVQGTMTGNVSIKKCCIYQAHLLMRKHVPLIQVEVLIGSPFFV
jgi:hypothetical protein